MPSLMSRLSLRPSKPKVFAKAMDNVKKTLAKTPSLRKNKSKKQNELIVVEENSKYVDENIEDAENYAANSNIHRDSVDVTNSVMIHNLYALQENSTLERQENSILERSTVSHENGREDSMATFIEDAEDSLLEEKAERPPSSSPIQFVVDRSMAEEIEPRNRESLNAISLDEPAMESVHHEASIEKVRTISISEPVIAPVETTEAKSSTVQEEEEIAAPVAPVEQKSESSVPSTVSKPDVFETLKRNNLAAARSTGSFGNLRARFENGGSKAPTPTLRSVLAARNSAKFARKEETLAAQIPVEAPKPVEIAPVVEIPAKDVEEEQPVESPVEVVEPAGVELASVEVKAEEQSIKEEIIEEEVQPVVAATTTAVKLSANTELLAKGDEKALFSAMMEIAAKPYKDQAVWFLNAYWNETFKDNAQQCERVWQFCNKFVELDSQGAKGCELDELRAHRVLEVLAEALTFTEMRTKFHRRAKHVSLIELLIFVFSADWTQVVMAPQGSDAAMEQMQQAEALMAKSSAALGESKTKASQAAEDEKRAEETARLALESKNKAVAGEAQATEAEARAIASETESTRREEEAAQAFEAASRAAEESTRAEAETVKRAEECAQAEAEARQVQEQAAAAERKAVADEQAAREAESEAFRREQTARESEQSAMEAEKCLIEGQARVEAALNKVKEEEAAFHKLLEDLKEKSENTSIGIVARRTAAHEREVLLAKNPDPLTRARIAEEAVVRKHEKLIRQAAGARAASSVSRAQAEESRDHAVKSRIASENTRAESAIRRSASETKAAAAAEARQVSEVARESARKAREESESRRKASDDALESARQAKESATRARLVATQEREAATAFKIAAEKDEQEALAAKDLASKSRENAEQAVVEAVNAFERARQFVERVRKQASSGQGGWWWASREIEESKRYVPQRMLKKLNEQQSLF